MATRIYKGLALSADSAFLLQRSQIVTLEQWIDAVGRCRQMIGRQVRVAFGVMQLMPETGASLKVGDIRATEANIHAGAKYMDQLMTKYFADAKFGEQDRTLFAFASYNAGPGNIARMRTEAAKRGLDPDKWFNNVEIVTAEKIGIKATTYVRNIDKYYASYKLTVDAQQAAGKAREQVAPRKS